MHRQTCFLLVVFLGLVPPLPAQVVIGLNTVIGPAGTNAATVDGVGQAVNFTGFAVNSGVTNLVAPGSSGSSAFDFNTGFVDMLDRATGSTAGAPNVWADLKFDSSSTAPLLLDTDNDGSFVDETPVTGFGLHGDTFITFDLDVIRTDYALPAGTPLILTGLAGLANPGSLVQTSAAIITDGIQRAVFDWNGGAGNTLSSFNLPLSGSTRYLTFIGLSGLDANNFYSHVGFGQVQLQSIPEPSAAWLLGAGLAALLFFRLRRV